MKTVFFPNQEFPLTPDSAELLAALLEPAIKTADDSLLVAALMDTCSQYTATLSVLKDCDVPKKPVFITQLVFRHIFQLVIEREIGLRILTDPNTELKELGMQMGPYSTESFQTQYRKAYQSSLQAVGL